MYIKQIGGVGNFILKIFVGLAVISLVLILIRLVGHLADLSGFFDFWKTTQFIWILSILLIGICAGFVLMALFWQPSLTYLTQKLTNPALAYHSLTTMIMIIKYGKWQKHVPVEKLLELLHDNCDCDMCKKGDK